MNDPLKPNISYFRLHIDGMVLTISVPATPKGQQLAENWLAMWNNQVIPLFGPATQYRLEIDHVRIPR